MEFRDLADMHAAWAEDRAGRFKKQRELCWLSADQLLEIVEYRPEALWKRIREYQGLRDAVMAIARDATHRGQSS